MGSSSIEISKSDLQKGRKTSKKGGARPVTTRRGGGNCPQLPPLNPPLCVPDVHGTLCSCTGFSVSNGLTFLGCNEAEVIFLGFPENFLD